MKLMKLENDIPKDIYAPVHIVPEQMPEPIRTGQTIIDPKDVNPEVKFGLYITLEPDLSPYYGSDQLEMINYWASLLMRVPKLSHIGSIIHDSLKMESVNDFNKLNYGLFPAGNSVHATSILYVKSGRYLASGCYHINTGDGVNNHKSLDGLYNVCILGKDKNQDPYKFINNWIDKGDAIPDRANFEQAYEIKNRRKIAKRDPMLSLPSQK